MASPAFPEPPTPRPPTPISDVDAAVDRVARRKDDWARVPIPQRIALLRRCLAGVLDVAEAWVADGARAKGIDPTDPMAGEEWIVGPSVTVRNIRLLVEALEAKGQPRPPKMRRREDGQMVARVYPANLQERALLMGFEAEVWLQRDRPPTQGAIYRQAQAASKVSLVLGAGNVSSIAPMDALYKLFVENEVVVLKMNPVNAHVGPHLERAFAALIDEGYLAIVYGGADVGAHLAEHPQIETLHVTGSDRTYDAIVWGADPAEQARRKAANDPKNARPFTAELGCVTPVLVVPGPWWDWEIDFQAHQVAAMVAQNASFNCNAAKVLVTASGWPQRAAFLAKVREWLGRMRPRKAYYPGAFDRYRAFLEHYPKAQVVGETGEGVVPWTLLPDVGTSPAEYALGHEAFCGVLAEVTLDAGGPSEFLEKAVDFANDVCWGTLSCTMLVHPATERDHAVEVDRAIARLRYGGIGINCWAAVVYALVSTTWGAYPGHPSTDIRSGTGVVHNTYLFDTPEKSVVRAPFVIRPTPPWFPDHKSLAAVGSLMTTYESAPSWPALLRLARAALKG